MAVSSSSLATMSAPPKYSIFTHSVGYHTAGHSLLHKLSEIASAGIGGVEIFTDDLWHFSQSELFSSILSSSTPLTPPDSPLSTHRTLAKPPQIPTQEFYNAFGRCSREEAELELKAAEYIKTYCDGLGLEIVCLQPIRDVEGWIDPNQRSEAMKRVESRFPIMRALGTELLLICSNNTPAPQTTGERGRLVGDFLHLSDLASSFTQATGHNIKIGYEALSWGAHVDLWSQAWAVVKAVDRSNVGLILDSFNTLAREFADPCSPSGIQEPSSATLTSLHHSLHRIASEVPGDKIFLLQLGDAKRLPEPLQPSPRVGEPRPSRMIWSRSSRLYPSEKERGGFMPVEEFVKAVVKAGYGGPWSIEVFNDSLNDTREESVGEHSRRAREGLDRLVEEVFA